MKRTEHKMKCTLKTVVSIFLLWVFLAGVQIGCTKQETPQQIAKQLLSRINSVVPGTRLETDLSKVSVEPMESGLFRIIFKDSTLTTDLTSLVKLINKTPFDKNQKESSVLESKKSTLREISYIYGPEKKYLALDYIEGIAAETDLSTTFSQDNPMMALLLAGAKIGFSIESIAFDNFNISHIFWDDKELSLEEQLENRRKNAKNNFQSLLNDIKIYLKANNLFIGNIKINITLGERFQFTAGDQDPDITDYFLKKGLKKPDLGVTLKKNRPIMNFSISSHKFAIQVIKDGQQWGGGGIDELKYSLFFGPDSDRKSFKLSYDFSIKGMEFSSPYAQLIKPLSHLEEMNFKYSMSNLKPASIMNLLDLIKGMMNAFEFKSGHGNLNDAMTAMTNLYAEIFKSNPEFQYTIKPFKHYFGNAELEAKMNIIWEEPEFKKMADIKMVLFDMDETIKRISEADELPIHWRQEILKLINSFMEKNAKGDGTLTYLLKSDQPGVALLNGKEFIVPGSQNNMISK